MKRLFKFMSMSFVVIYILVRIQNVLQDYLEIKTGNSNDEEMV
ncbi:hypothetical protein V070_02418 [Staphylococcus aureus C0673]|nr:hypothetical protein V070_02418 [Staphylococcus aureus C0673]